MIDRLNDEHLCDLCGLPSSFQSRQMAAELLALRARNAKLETGNAIAETSNYAAGMVAGWNFCLDGKIEEFNRRCESHMLDVARAVKADAPQ